MKREADFSQMLKALRGERPDRPVFFEFIVDPKHHARVQECDPHIPEGAEEICRSWMKGMHACGFDCSTLPIWAFGLGALSKPTRESQASVGMAHGGIIKSWQDFESYDWPDLDEDDWSVFEKLAPELPEGMKFMAHSHGGTLENLIELVGWEDLVFMMEDEPDLAHALTDKIGSFLLDFYKRVVTMPGVGGCIINDDWGFRTQTFLSPAQMEEFIFPWVRKKIQVIHQAGLPAMLHSCGCLDSIWPEVLKFGLDGKHSWEDAILPIEQAYDRFHPELTLVGGIDLDYLCRADPQDIYRRTKAMLQKTECRGWVAGSGNSIPSYVPFEGFNAMRRAVLEGWD